MTPFNQPSVLALLASFTAICVALCCASPVAPELPSDPRISANGVRLVKRLTGTLMTRPSQRKAQDHLNPSIVDVTPRTLRRIPRPTPSVPVETTTDLASNMAGGSLSSNSRRRDRLAPCERRSKNRTLEIAGCLPVRVDVGGCYGACPSREQPIATAQLGEDGSLSFPTSTRCRCCRAFTFETKMVSVSCHSEGGEELEEYEIAVKVINTCECRRCDRANVSQ